MFKGGQYDVINIPMPAEGMNQKLAPEILPKMQTWWLENIIPMPLGRGQVRFGCNALNRIVYHAETNPDGLRHDALIQEVFEFTKADGTEQLLLYVQDFKKDDEVTDSSVLTATQLRFKSPNRGRYQVNTPIKIVYQKAGVNTLYADVDVHTDGADNQVTLTLSGDEFPTPFDDGVIQEVYYPWGKIYLYDLKQAQLQVIKEDVAINSVPRAVLFKNQLVICNGVDRIMRFDGTAVMTIHDFVAEQAAAFNRTANKSFTFTIQQAWEPIFKLDKYQNNQIQLKTNHGVSTLTTTNAVKNGLTITVNTVEDLPEFAGEIRLFYRDYPPAFSYLYVLNNRLWALGAGAVGLSYRAEPLKVYVTYQAESLTDWFDEKTKQVPFIDMGYKHGRVDNFEAITAIGNQMAFIGRHQTQIWQGSNPLEAEEFTWQATIEAGIAHGNLLLNVANDVFFISTQGVMSFSTLNIARQFAMTSLNAVDPLVRQYIKSIVSSEKQYRMCRAFYYKSGAFAGFKIGEHKTLIAMTDTTLTGWSLFSGVFQYGLSFLSAFDRLFISKQNKVLHYADGRIGPPRFVDENQAFTFTWTLPVISFNARKYACKRYQINAEYPSSLVIDRSNTLSMTVSGDLPKSFSLSSPYRLDFRGDPLQSIVLANDTDPESLGMRLDSPYQHLQGRLKFVATSFWATLSGVAYQGPLIFKNLYLYGRKER